MEPIISLLVLGAFLMVLETILPGIITGIIGFLCLVAAVVLGYQDFGFHSGSLLLGGVLVALIVGLFSWVKFFPESGIAKRFISQNAIGELGVVDLDLLHRTGVAITQLRPSGAAFINGKRVDVITEGGLIDRGASLRVVGVEGIRVVVREE